MTNHTWYEIQQCPACTRPVRVDLALAPFSTWLFRFLTLRWWTTLREEPVCCRCGADADPKAPYKRAVWDKTEGRYLPLDEWRAALDMRSNLGALTEKETA